MIGLISIIIFESECVRVGKLTNDWPRLSEVMDVMNINDALIEIILNASDSR